jgi:hypothetical protein
MAIDDERLMAYADGELSAADAAEVERAMASDEAVAARVAIFADSRKAVKRAYGAPPPVSDALTARIKAMAATDAALRGTAVEGNVVALAPRRRSVPFWQLPVAASVALAVGVLGGWMGKPGQTPDGALGIAGLGDLGLVEAMATVPSGERVEIGNDAVFAAIATFRDGEGRLCREFEHDRGTASSVVAVACHDDGAWQVLFAVAAAGGDEGYAPASSLETLDAWLVATEAGAPLSDADEAAALSALR